MEKRRGQWRIEKSGLDDMVGRYTFSNFRTETKMQKTMMNMAQEFLKQETGWFFVGGQVGSGKTHICTAIANEFMERGKSLRYMVWTDEVTKLKSIKLDEEAYRKEIAGWKRADIVYIDDLLKVRTGSQPTDADINIAFELINSRYNERNLVTIISSERTIAEILELDEGVGSRIFQRCGNFKLSISRDKEKNYRLQQ
ncbi:MAG: ATP-binding protein [Anaerotignum sp.]